MNSLPPELAEIVLRKSSKNMCGRHPTIDAKLFSMHLYDNKTFFILLVEKNAYESVRLLSDWATSADLRPCLKTAIEKGHVELIWFLTNHIHLTRSQFKKNLKLMVRCLKTLEMMKEVFHRIKVSPKQASMLAQTAKNTLLSAKNLIELLSELGASFLDVCEELLWKVFHEQDIETLKIINSELFKKQSHYYQCRDPRFDTIVKTTTFKLDFMREFLDSPLKSILGRSHYLYILTQNVQDPDYIKAVLSSVPEPEKFFSELLSQKMYDMAESLITFRQDLVWPTFAEEYSIRCDYSDWPDSLLDLYLNRITARRVALRSFYKPVLKSEHSAGDSIARSVYKIIRACERTGTIFDAEADLALAWACQVGDIAAVQVYKDVVPLYLNRESPFLRLALDWENTEVVNILKSDLPSSIIKTTERALKKKIRNLMLIEALQH